MSVGYQGSSKHDLPSSGRTPGQRARKENQESEFAARGTAAQQGYIPCSPTFRGPLGNACRVCGSSLSQPLGFEGCSGTKGCGQAMTYTPGCCGREKEKRRKEEEGLQRRTRESRRTAASTADDSPLHLHICTGTRPSMRSMDR
jgi:hypothetical protein